MEKSFERIAGGLISQGETALLAVSGGIDSMCMAELAYRCGLDFAVAHCNFHLRGEESDGDEALVREWAESRGVRFHRADFDTYAYAERYSVSIEMAARDLRYDWFLEVCEQNGYQVLAVAHNANDNAETLILNLLRGTGLRGITGMRADGNVPAPGGENVRMIRPLLGFSRKEIEDYAASAGVKYREDHTNRETVYKRNKLRHNVFPVFEEINPSFLNAFAREMEVFAQEYEIAEEYFLLNAGDVIEPVREGERLRINVERLLSVRHWRYVLYRLLEKYGFRNRRLEPVIRLLESGETLSGKVFEAPEFRLVTEPGMLVVKELRQDRPAVSPVRFRRGPASGPFSGMLSENESCSVVRTDGRYEFDGMRFSVSTEAAGEDPVSKARDLAARGILAFDSGKLKMPFIVRTWRKGDWMRPMGMKGRRKLSDIFTDLKLGREAKSRALVVVSPELAGTVAASGNASGPGSVSNAVSGNEKAGERVAAVCGYSSGSFFCRIDEAVRISGSSTSVIYLDAR